MIVLVGAALVAAVATIALFVPAVALAGVEVTFLLSLTPLASHTGALDPRFAAVPFTSVLVIHALRAKQPLGQHALRILVFLVVLMVTIGLCAMLATGVHAGNGSSPGLVHSVGSVVAIGLVTTTCWASLKIFTQSELRQHLRRFLALALAISLLLALSPSGFVGYRAAGVFGNPNGLGLAAMLTVPLVATSPTKRSRAILLGAIGVALLLAASRAAMGGAAIEALVLFLPRRARLSRKVAISIGSLGLSTIAITKGLDLLPSAGAGSHAGLLRHLFEGRGARLSQWTTGVHLFTAQPLVGVGPAADAANIASSYLTLLAECGALGIILCLWGAWLLRGSYVNGSLLVRALILGAAFDALFESWFFVGGSWFFLIFWLAVANEMVSRTDRNGLAPPSFADPAGVQAPSMAP